MSLRSIYAVIACGVCACSGSSSPPAGNADSGGADSGGAAGDLCASFPANTATVITDTTSTTAYPGASAAGGNIESGTYFEVEHLYYQPATAPAHTWQGVMVIDAAAGTSITNINRDGTVFQQTGAKFTTNGTKFTVALTCPSAVAGTGGAFSYTYAAGKLTIFTDADKTGTAFQKQ